MADVDVLVDNAGLISPTRRLTGDGNELTFQVNHLAGFLLTRLLHQRGTAPRVVNVASIGQHPIDFGDLTLEHGYEPYRAVRAGELSTSGVRPRRRGRVRTGRHARCRVHRLQRAAARGAVRGAL